MWKLAVLWCSFLFSAVSLGTIPASTQHGSVRTDVATTTAWVSLLQKSAAIKDAGWRRTQAVDPRSAAVGTLYYGDCAPIANVRERLSLVNEALPSVYDAVDVMIGLDRVDAARDGDSSRLRQVEADSRTRLEQESFQHQLERAAIAFDGVPLSLGSVQASASAVAANAFGDEAVVLVQKYLEEVRLNFTHKQVKVHAVVDDANVQLSKALQEFAPRRDIVTGNFSFAVDRVADLCDSRLAEEDERFRERARAQASQTTTAAPASHSSLWMVRSWLKNFVHGKSLKSRTDAVHVDDRFSRAKLAVLAANATVLQTSDMFDEFDVLASAQVDRVAAEARNGLTALRLLQPADLGNEFSELPLAVASILATQLNVAFDKVSSDVNTFSDSVFGSSGQIQAHVQAARRDLSDVFRASDELMAMVEEARAKDVAARKAAQEVKEAVAARKVAAPPPPKGEEVPRSESAN